MLFRDELVAERSFGLARQHRGGGFGGGVRGGGAHIGGRLDLGRGDLVFGLFGAALDEISKAFGRFAGENLCVGMGLGDDGGCLGFRLLKPLAEGGQNGFGLGAQPFRPRRVRP